MTASRNRAGGRGAEPRRDRAGRKEGRERPGLLTSQFPRDPGAGAGQRAQASWQRWTPWLLVLLASLASYANILGNDFIGDAKILIAENPDLLNSHEWLRWFLRDYYWGSRLGDTTLYRPLTILSFLATIRLAGSNPLGFNLGNLLLHTAVSLLVLALGRRLVGSGAALAGALLFAVHPLHTEAVAWAVGRAELLAALFAILTALAFFRATDADTRHPAPFGIATALSFLAALLSKEHVIPLPAWLALVWLLERKSRPLGRTALTMAGVAAAIAPFLLLRSMALQRPTVPVETLFNPVVDVPVLERWLTAAAVIARYAALFVWPGTLSVNYSYAQILPSRSVGGLEAVGLALILALGTAIVLAASRAPGLALSLAFVPATFFVVSNIPFPIGTIMAERLTYLASVGLCLAVGWVVGLAIGSVSAAQPTAMETAPRADGKRLWRRWVVVGLSLVVLVALGARTLIRNRDWRDEYSLMTKALAASPRSAHAMTGLASLERKRGNHARALALLTEAIRIYPRYVGARMDLGDLAVLHLNEWRLAEEQYRAVTQLAPRYPAAHYNLGSLLARTGRTREAETEFRAATAHDPGLSEAHLALANLLLDTGRPAEALERYRTASQLVPIDNRPLFGLARASLALGKKDEARRYAREAVAAGFEVPEDFWRLVGASR